jgi:hypothetical protein
MATPVFVFCENNCRYEGMTKEQILAAIAQAVETGTVGNCDTGFITTVKTINGRGLKFFVGTQAEYDGLSKTQKDGVFALITNDTTKDGLLRAIEDLQIAQTDINNTFTAITAGALTVPKASHAVNADYAERALSAEAVFNNTAVLEDLANGGFIITEAGIYALIGHTGSDITPSMNCYYISIIAIPYVDRQAIGAPAKDYSDTNTKEARATYMSYDIADLYNTAKYRLQWSSTENHITADKVVMLARL